MLTTDLALRFDPIYEPISRRFHEHPDELADAFARAWFKLTHRDMGPIERYLGPEVPSEKLLWQDPVPEVTHELIGAEDIAALKAQILASGLSVSQLVSTAWASASTFRGSDKRGGANGARIRLEPQRGWEVNDPEQLATVLRTLEGIQAAFDKPVSLADLIVLAGSAAVEQAASDGGVDVEVPFTPGRTDASQEQTDVDSFEALEPTADGFRNYLRPEQHRLPAEYLLRRPREPADPERPRADRPRSAACASWARTTSSPRSASSPRQPGSLTNDFFVNLLDLGTAWTASGDAFEGRDVATGDLRVDRQPRRPRVRLELRAARARGGLRER